MLSTLKGIILKKAFNQSLEIFITKGNKIFGVNPLCGSRTFAELARKKIIKVDTRNSNKLDFIITRDETERLISAYNKKIIANDDWKKLALRWSSYLKFKMSFNDYLKALILMKKNNIFIDKHFKPCTEDNANELIEISNSSRLEELIGLEENYLKNNKTKSSKDVAGNEAININNIDNEGKLLLDEYFGLYK